MDRGVWQAIAHGVTEAQMPSTYAQIVHFFPCKAVLTFALLKENNSC